VTSHSLRLTTLFLALLCLMGARADADEAPPSPAALQSARSIIVGSGMTRSFDLIVPQMFGELERNVIATRPELKDNLHIVLLALVPEFVKTEEVVVDGAAHALARRMNEQELKDTAAFFVSPAGKKYVEAEPLAYKDIVDIVQKWREKLSVDVLTRAREEMKKKGQDF
jgi:uncharacterized protein